MDVNNSNDSKLAALVKTIEENEDSFKNDETEGGQRLYYGLGALKDGIKQLTSLASSVQEVAPNFDFSPEVPGNGFRSLCSVFDSAFKSVSELCSKLSSAKGKLMFRKMHFVRETEAWTQALGALIAVFTFTVESLLPLCSAPDGDLIMLHCNQNPVELIKMLTTVPLNAFYGRCLGFHYISSLHKTFQLLTLSLCAFSQAYYSDGNVWSRTKQSLLASSHYISSPELRARRLVTVMHRASVNFIKAFWDLSETEIVSHLPSLVSPSLAVYQAISVPCEEMTVPHVTEEGRFVVTPPPSSHVPPAPIPCYLMSQRWRKGMPGSGSVKLSTVLPPSPNLLIHCHGGGFITQSTKSQEMFLREWTSGLDCPLLSIDYTLAPYAPYPRALEEVLTVYCWALTHTEMLGTTAQKIVLTGDSAGGSLITGLTLRCIQLGIRPPDGLFIAYAPFMMKLLPSPAKLLGVMDPMLPLSFALRCLKAYAGDSDITGSTFQNKEKEAPASTENEQPQETLGGSSPPLIFSQRNDPAMLSLDDESPRAFSPSKTILTIDETDDANTVDLQTNSLKVGEDSAAKLCPLSPSAHSEAASDTLTTISLASDVSKIKKGEESEMVQEVDSSGAKEERSKKYVAEFLEKYVLETVVNESGECVPILRTEDSVDTNESFDEGVMASTTNATWSTINKIGAAKDAVVSGLSSGISSVYCYTQKSSPEGDTIESPVQMTPEPTKKRSESLNMDSTPLVEEFQKNIIIDDPFINSLEAPREMLERFPPTNILTVEFDFCLDDCVCMAKLLRSLKVPVRLDVLKGLPHGFLNLCYLAPETKAGCALAVERIRDLFEHEKK